MPIIVAAPPLEPPGPPHLFEDAYDYASSKVLSLGGERGNAFCPSLRVSKTSYLGVPTFRDDVRREPHSQRLRRVHPVLAL